MLVDISQLFEVLIWTPKYHNVKITRNGNTQCFHVEFKIPNVLNTTDSTNQKIIENSDDIIRPMRRQILYILKQRKASHACIHSNTPTVRAITKQTQIFVCSGGIGLTGNGIKRNMLRFMKTGLNRFVQSWTATLNNDLWQLKNFFPKCSKELTHHQYHFWDPTLVQYYFHSRASIVHHSCNSKYLKLWRRSPS